jgi:PHP family Zn ribbon phosphoesterase
MKNKSGYFTIYEETEYDVDINDIISNLDCFDENQLKELKDVLEDEINNTETLITTTNLEDEQKIKILNELFDKCTWEQLENIRKSL